MTERGVRVDAAAAHGGDSVMLRAERLLRRLASEGNRSLIANRVVLDLADSALEQCLRTMFERMGARLAPRGTTSPLQRTADLGARLLVVSDATGAAATVPAHAAGTAIAHEHDASKRIDWAMRQMLTTAHLATELELARTLRGRRILLSLVLEAKTAAFALTLQRIGAQVAVFGAVQETDPAVAAELTVRGCIVFAPRSAPPATSSGATPSAEVRSRIDAEHARQALAWQPELLVDDGSHLIRLAHTEHPALLPRAGDHPDLAQRVERSHALPPAVLLGASEETTSGVRPLTQMHAEGALRIPVIAANDARTKTGYDNLIGTGQSCVLAIADLLDTPETASRSRCGAGVSGGLWVVIGYGPVGRGIARFAAALGARVTIVERDAVRALDALHDGYEALPLARALPEADVVVSATGVWHTITLDAVMSMQPGTVVAVAGGIDNEIAIDELRAANWRCDRVAPMTDVWLRPEATPGAAGVLILAEGAGINYTAAEGNPVEVMDLSFATQMVALARLVTGQDTSATAGQTPLAPGMYRVSETDEQRVARAALACFGGATDPGSAPRAVGGAAQDWRTHRYRSMSSTPSPLPGAAQGSPLES